MRVIADTNVLVRAIVADDEAQAAAARRALDAAEAVALPIAALCEFVWVLRRGYRIPAEEIAAALRGLAETAECLLDRPALEAGLAMMEAGGDFADGVIAHEGVMLGGETFLSFDRAAVARLRARGLPADIPA